MLNMLNAKYYDLLTNAGKFIDKYDIDVSTVKKSTINLINNCCRLRTLNKQCFSEAEDEVNDETDNEDDEINSETSIKNNSIINNLNIVLQKAIMSKNEELMNNTIKLMNKLLKTKQESSATNLIPDSTRTYFKTPKWIRTNRCTINPENNKKLGNQSFKYAIVTFKTSGINRCRLKNIEQFMNDFNFTNINYPPEEKDYELFEKNNQSIKITIFKTTENEKELLIHYNQKESNDRTDKIYLILLGNNHYIYVTKLGAISKYVKYY